MNSNNLFSRAMALENKNMHEEALSLYQQCLNQGNYEAAIKIANLYLYRFGGSYDPVKAETYFNIALKYDKCKGRAYNGLGNLACNQAKYDLAEKYYNLALEHYCKNAHRNLGNLYHDRSDLYGKKNIGKSIYHYKKAVEEGFDECNIDLAKIFIYELDDFDAAKKYAELILKLDDKKLHIDANKFLAELYCCHQFGKYVNPNIDFDKAIEYYHKFINLEPQNNRNTGYFNIADCYQDKKDYENAMIYYNKSIEINKCVESSYRKIAHIYLESEKNVEKAKEYLEKAIFSNNWPHPLAAIELGDIYMSEGNIDKALDFYIIAKKILKPVQKDKIEMVDEKIQALYYK